ncbi:MAG: phosphate acyltransferase PlsX [Chloroflexi bacterium]|nr:phosphate acyltransferase PlsX [Chloroflexota bacterium]
MEDNIIIAVDAMGGDHAPDEIVRGALKAAVDNIASILLVGDEEKIKPLCRGGYPENMEILHTDEYVTMDENPSQALKKKKRASMLLAADAVREGKASGMVCAGNTGALLESALLHIGRIKGVRRPALGTLWPTRNQPTLMLDAGANAECKPEYLVQFAHMGAIYAEKVMERPNPRVALINIGHEEGKGNALTNEAYMMLKDAGLNFTGNIEPRDFLGGAADVAVCDGFTGNMVLKTAEATASYFFKLVKEVLMSSLFNKAAGVILKPSFTKLKGRLDHSEYGGATFLGINGVCIKSHGSAEARTIYNAVKLARQCARNDVVGIISHSFSTPVAIHR